jgi:hypothetical protein
MLPDNGQIANFIIGGTEKAGTTSVYTYLGQHPEVCSSRNKETDFFRHDFTGDLSGDRNNYARYFSACSEQHRIVMEASPGYLGEATSVAPRIARLIPDVRMLFILRDPVERMYSSFNFHQGRLDISDKLDFGDYVEICLAYDRGEASADELGLDEWYLKVLRFGCYAEYLEKYYQVLAADQIKVMGFEQLTGDVAGFMRELSTFLNIDAEFWNTYEFRKSNVTFRGSNKALHRAAIFMNNRMEPILRRHPALKHGLVNIYKRLNQSREGYDPMPGPALETLRQYYHPHNQALRRLPGLQDLPDWGS